MLEPASARGSQLLGWGLSLGPLLFTSTIPETHPLCSHHTPCIPSVTWLSSKGTGGVGKEGCLGPSPSPCPFLPSCLPAQPAQLFLHRRGRFHQLRSPIT